MYWLFVGSSTWTIAKISFFFSTPCMANAVKIHFLDPEFYGLKRNVQTGYNENVK